MGLSACKAEFGATSGPALAAAFVLLMMYPAAAQSPPAAVQPTLPQPAKAQAKSPSFPVVDTIASGQQGRPEAERSAIRPRKTVRRRVVHRFHDRGPALDRPTLAGVVLVEPIARRLEPRPIVPAPAFFLDGIATAFTTPPPPVVCRRRPRDPDLPDPGLYREVPLACAYDID